MQLILTFSGTSKITPQMCKEKKVLVLQNIKFLLIYRKYQWVRLKSLRGWFWSLVFDTPVQNVNASINLWASLECIFYSQNIFFLFQLFFQLASCHLTDVKNCQPWNKSSVVCILFWEAEFTCFTVPFPPVPAFIYCHPLAYNLFKAQHLANVILSADAFRTAYCTVIV